MSLINDLLRDLEDRRGGNKERHELVEGLSHVHETAASNNTKFKYALSGILTVVILLAFILFIPVSTIHEDKSSKPRASTDSTGSVNHVNVEADTAEKHTSAQRQAIIPDLKLDHTLSLVMADDQTDAKQLTTNTATVTQVVVKDIVLNPHEAGMEAKLALSQEADYKLYRLNSPERLVVEIPGGELGEYSPDDIENELVQSVRDGIHGGYLRLVFDLRKPVQVISKSIAATGDSYTLSILLKTDLKENQQQTSLVASKNKEINQKTKAVHNRQMEKKPRNNNTGSLAEKKFREGVRQYKQGDLEGSIESLTEAIRLKPDNGNARYLLASAYIQQDRSESALALLAQSVEMLPGDVKIKQLYAQILFHLGRHKTAIEILRTSKPVINEQPEYHALLAAILQDMDKHTESADIYQRLVKLHPDKSIWWMGLGISLEALGQVGEAVAAYEEALQSGSLTSNLRQYVSKRIKFLTDEKRT